MKRIIFIFAIIAAVLLATFSQKDKKAIQISGQAEIPTGDLADIVKTGFGGAAKDIYGFSIRLAYNIKL